MAKLRLQLLAVIIAAFGLPAPFVATAATSASPVCTYMGRLKNVWDSTEPPPAEKTALRTLAEGFQAEVARPDRKELDRLEAVLVSFGSKVERRTAGTRSLVPTPQTAEARRRGLEFLAKVDEVVRLSRALIVEMKPSPNTEWAEDAVTRLQQLDGDVRFLGGRFNQEVLRVRRSAGT